MAAADYYNPGGNMPQAPPVQAPRPQQQYPYQPQQSTSTLPYPVSDAPPPYSAFADQARPHSQPPPQTRPQQHVNFAPTNNYGPAETHAYPPDKQPYRPSAMQNVTNAHPSPGTYAPSQPSPYRPAVQPSQGYPFPNGLAPPPTEPQRRASGGSSYRPAVTPYQDDYDYDSRSVSRDRGSRRRHHHHHDDQSNQKKKGKNSVSTFLGAGGGALIGDLIFPGLGTIGGAVLGGVGGHEYGKQRRSYSNTDGRSKSYHSSRDYEYDDGLDKRGRRRDVY